METGNGFHAWGQGGLYTSCGFPQYQGLLYHGMGQSNGLALNNADQLL